MLQNVRPENEKDLKTKTLIFLNHKNPQTTKTCKTQLGLSRIYVVYFDLMQMVTLNIRNSKFDNYVEGINPLNVI